MTEHISELYATRANESQLPAMNGTVLCYDKAFTKHIAYLLLFDTMPFSDTTCFSASQYIALHSKMTTSNKRKLASLLFLLEPFRDGH